MWVTPDKDNYIATTLLGESIQNFVSSLCFSNDQNTQSRRNLDVNQQRVAIKTFLDYFLRNEKTISTHGEFGECPRHVHRLGEKINLLLLYRDTGDTEQLIERVTFILDVMKEDGYDHVSIL